MKHMAAIQLLIARNARMSALIEGGAFDALGPQPTFVLATSRCAVVEEIAIRVTSRG
jgi:hypothetical protein